MILSYLLVYFVRFDCQVVSFIWNILVILPIIQLDEEHFDHYSGKCFYWIAKKSPLPSTGHPRFVFSIKERFFSLLNTKKKEAIGVVADAVRLCSGPMPIRRRHQMPFFYRNGHLTSSEMGLNFGENEAFCHSFWRVCFCDSIQAIVNLSSHQITDIILEIGLLMFLLLIIIDVSLMSWYKFQICVIFIE